MRLVDLGEIFAAIVRGFGMRVEVKYVHEVRGAPINPETGDHSEGGELQWWRWGKRCIVVSIGDEGE